MIPIAMLTHISFEAVCLSSCDWAYYEDTYPVGFLATDAAYEVATDSGRGNTVNLASESKASFPILQIGKLAAS